MNNQSNPKRLVSARLSPIYELLDEEEFEEAEQAVATIEEDICD